MKSWKITLKNGKVLHESNYNHIYRSSTEWVISQNIEKIKSNITGYLWWKKMIREKEVIQDTLKIIPTCECLMAEWAEVEKEQCDSPKATDPAKPSEVFLGLIKSEAEAYRKAMDMKIKKEE